jgi:hypothetical protein
MEEGYTRRVEDNALSQMQDRYLQNTLKTQSKLSTVYLHIYLIENNIFDALFTVSIRDSLLSIAFCILRLSKKIM